MHLYAKHALKKIQSNTGECVLLKKIKPYR